MPFDPAANVMGGAAPSPETTPSPNNSDVIANPAPTVSDAPLNNRKVPAVDPQVAKFHHESMLGKAVKSIFGVQQDYVPDPDHPGQVKAVPVKQTPGSLFRNILAGAIIGGAAGSHARGPSGGFLPGLAMGGEAAMQHDRDMNTERYNRARQGIKDQQEQEKLDLERQEADTRQKLANAQMALTNSEVVKNFQLIQGSSYELHDKMVKDFAPEVEAYTLAGIKPVATGLKESEAQQWVKDHPGVSSMRPVATGIVPYTDKNGTKTFETTFSLYPNKGISLTKNLIDQMNKNGMNDMYPGWSEHIQPGSPSANYDAVQWSTLMQQYHDAMGKHLQQQVEEAKIAEANGLIKEHAAQTALAYAQADLAKYGKTKDQQTELAWTAFDKTKDKDGNYHLDQVPDSQKRLIVSSMQPQIDSLGKEIDNLKDSDEKNSINPASDKLLQQRMQEYDEMTRVQKLVVQRLNDSAKALDKTPASPPAPDTSQVTKDYVDRMVEKGVKPAQYYNYIENDPSLKNENDKLDALKASGAIVPWSKVLELANSQNQPTAKIVSMLKGQGLKVAEPERQAAVPSTPFGPIIGPPSSRQIKTN